MPIIGTQQSPIQIIHDNTFHAHFPCSYFEFNGYDTQDILDGTFGSENFIFDHPPTGLNIHGQTWYLHRVHFHHQAEHLLDTLSPEHSEVHLIHFQSLKPQPTDPKVVLAGFFELGGKASSARHSFKNLTTCHLQKSKSKSAAGRAKCGVNPNHFLPDQVNHWYHYQGSLTSGTFSEDVSWFLMANCFQVAASEVKFLKEKADQDTRGCFALDRRFVLRSFE